MNKLEFKNELVKKLSRTFPDDEIQNAILYYEEIIDERCEHGEYEENIIHSFGDISTIVSKITAEIVVKRSETKSVKIAWRNFIIILAICSSPVLLPVGIAFVGVAIGLGVAFISVVFALLLAAIAVAISLIPLLGGLFYAGAGIAEIILGAGLILISFGLITMVLIKIYQIGVWLFAKVSQLFGRIVNRKIKEAN
jgi:uncharacterized membrane protein